MLIEIFADLICPWCYIGKRRLDRALAERPGVSVDLRWLPYQLNPEMPVGGMDRAHYLAAKFGGGERARLVQTSIRQAAEQDGLTLRLDRIARTPNTLDAHRLIRLAERQGRATPVALSLFRAYFEEGRDIGRQETLLDIAVENGLARADVARDLERGAGALAVRTADNQARQLGINAVPCFIFNRRYALSGAQEPAAFLPLIDIAEAESMADPVSVARPFVSA